MPHSSATSARDDKRAGNQLIIAVDARGDAVHISDEGARAAADHAQPDGRFPFSAISFTPLAQTEHLAVGRIVGARVRKIVERAFR